ncbi:hypothetical protein HYH02_010959 [Chlamydomonas schloesseri]|uniref:EamA domain-containing protein n=1 Tax=Chlamydomonas schloesseri TaxID=2026947 RepID=A0A835TIC9_9CHLO|nr:hypothetical protein HYH02_010959 [Chlamydomonas schloesseri]|eukprot:KAG2438260.1 hypothetical protein HYH02_010959 [Chlamydomonas schloesseri]
MPTTQAFFNYLLLGLTCGGYHLWKRGPRLTNRWYLYLLLAALDVEANFLVTKAYQYTSVTSVTLLDCFTIPAVMALSAAALAARYLPGHYGGALLCIGGLAVLVATDGSSATGGPNPVLGDALVLMGSVLYAVSNVAQERLLLGATPVSELLAAVGGFGAVLGGVQAVVLERGAWAAADWSSPWATAAPLLGFSLALYTFALLLPRVLLWGGATVLNLSLLTSDVWAAAARVVFFGGFGGTEGWFALSLVLEVAGLVLYTAAGQTHQHPGGPGGGGAGGGAGGGEGDGDGEGEGGVGGEAGARGGGGVGVLVVGGGGGGGGWERGAAGGGGGGGGGAGMGGFCSSSLGFQYQRIVSGAEEERLGLLAAADGVMRLGSGSGGGGGGGGDGGSKASGGIGGGGGGSGYAPVGRRVDELQHDWEDSAATGGGAGEGAGASSSGEGLRRSSFDMEGGLAPRPLVGLLPQSPPPPPPQQQQQQQPLQGGRRPGDG